jgi:hypothetical protein
MGTKSVEEKSIEKRKLLEDPLVSAAFNHYFDRNWQAKQLLDELRSLGVDTERLREWALYSFHPLRTDEADEKRKRGRKMKTLLKEALVGYKSAIAFYSIYASPPRFDWPESVESANAFKRLIDLNRYLANEATVMMERANAKGLFNTRRLGVNWNGPYLYLGKSYIGRIASWQERKILGVMVHLIAAAHISVHLRVPNDLRSLLKKTLQAFENDPRNVTIIGRIEKATAFPDVLDEMFPPLTRTQN